ncbi:MAG TPA: MmgE/PrpD family protein [Burkholderiales bacterium]|nr:MmgE/PrpD family protein [Burkholderiales bacterium]
MQMPIQMPAPAARVPANVSRELSEFLSGLRFEDIPAPVVLRTEELFLDWFASALAGKGARPVRILDDFAAAMGPSGGTSEIFVSRRTSSPLFAALVNAAASHFVEQDDLHNSSVLHPGTVVFPAVVAVAQEIGASGRDVIAASVAGYECGIRVGEFLGRSHYKVFHTTGTAGKLGAAAGVARLLGLDAHRMNHCLGSAGTMAAGLWEFLRDAADSKQLHTAKAAADGLMAAYIARDGFTGAQRIFEGEQGMGAGMSSDADPALLVAGLGSRWATAETSFKYHASCRHTHPAADALAELMRINALGAGDIVKVTAHVHQGALDVLGPVTDPRSVHQSKFSMGFVLAQIAVKGRAQLADFTDAALGDAALRSFHDKVQMVLDPEIDRAYPRRWIGRVSVLTRDGRTLEHKVISPKGDPDNTLSRAELEDKALRLAAYAGGATEPEMRRAIARVWALREQRDLRNLLG